MDAGDADVEDVGVAVVALDDGERVIALASLRVHEASTRASGRARADEATTDADPGMDAGDADVEEVLVAVDDDRVVAAVSLRAALRRRRATDVSDAGRSRRLC